MDNLEITTECCRVLWLLGYIINAKLLIYVEKEIHGMQTVLHCQSSLSLFNI